MRFTEDFPIDCPPGTAFDIIADVRNESQWNDDVSRVELTTGEPIGHDSQFITHHGPHSERSSR